MNKMKKINYHQCNVSRNFNKNILKIMKELSNLVYHILMKIKLKLLIKKEIIKNK